MSVAVDCGCVGFRGGWWGVGFKLLLGLLGFFFHSLFVVVEAGNNS